MALLQLMGGFTEERRSPHMESLQKGLGDKIAVVDWDGWFYGTGWGPVRNQFDTTLADSAIALGKRYGVIHPRPSDQIFLSQNNPPLATGRAS